MKKARNHSADLAEGRLPMHVLNRLPLRGRERWQGPREFDAGEREIVQEYETMMKVYYAFANIYRSRVLAMNNFVQGTPWAEEDAMMCLFDVEMHKDKLDALLTSLARC